MPTKQNTPNTIKKRIVLHAPTLSATVVGADGAEFTLDSLTAEAEEARTEARTEAAGRVQSADDGVINASLLDPTPHLKDELAAVPSADDDIAAAPTDAYESEPATTVEEELTGAPTEEHVSESETDSVDELTAASTEDGAPSPASGTEQQCEGNDHGSGAPDSPTQQPDAISSSAAHGDTDAAEAPPASAPEADNDEAAEHDVLDSFEIESVGAAQPNGGEGFPGVDDGTEQDTAGTDPPQSGQTIPPAPQAIIVSDPVGEHAADETTRIPVDGISPSPYQPRSSSDEGDPAFLSLAAHIREFGLMHPVAVRVLHDGSHELLAGARRLQACRSLGCSTIPARLFHDVSDTAARAMVVAENFARQDLLPLEAAHAFAALQHAYKADKRKFDVRSLEIATGQSKSSIGNLLKIHTVVDDAMIALVRQIYGDTAADAVPRLPKTKLLRAAQAPDVAAAASLLAEAHDALPLPPHDAVAPGLESVDDTAESKSVHMVDKQDAQPPHQGFKISWSRKAPLKVSTTRPLAELSARDARRLLAELKPVLATLRARCEEDEGGN